MLKTVVDIFCFITDFANNYEQILNLIFLDQPLLCGWSRPTTFAENIKILSEDQPTTFAENIKILSEDKNEKKIGKK